MQDTISNMLEGVRAFFTEATADMALRLLGAVATLLIGLFVVKRLVRLFERLTKNSKLDRGVLSFFGSLISITLKAVLIIIVATSLGVPSTSFIAILSSVGLAVGLALQGSLGNFAGGLMLLTFHPFRVGDYISTPDADGTVASVSIMYTTLTTFDGKKVVLPNSTLSNGVVTNFSAHPQRRADVSFALAWDTDVDRAKGIMLAAAQEHPLVLQAPEPTARMGSSQEGRLHFTLRAWCKTPDYWTVVFDLNETLKRAFDRAGISVPPPGREVITLSAGQGGGPRPFSQTDFDGR